MKNSFSKLSSLDPSLRLPLAIGLTFLYNFLFWQEGLGLNFMIYTLALMLLLRWMNPKAFRSHNVRIAAAGTMFTATWVLIHHSAVAQLAHVLSLALFVGFVHLPALRSVHYAAADAIGSLVLSLKALKTELFGIRDQHASVKRIWNYARLSLIPLALLSLFYLLYSVANPRLAAASQYLLEAFGDWWLDFSLTHVFFLLLGLLIAVAVVYKPQSVDFTQDDRKEKDLLKRIRLKRKVIPFLGLKKEHRIALLSFILVNALLLINNATDIPWIWFQFDPGDGSQLKQLVHEGTYLLILSILLSMGVMLHFFRGNQNFYPKNLWLKRLSYLWIFQNGLLLVSVALRNYHYIQWYGMAYKRIGVFFFLALTLFGLFSLYLKIRDRKSAYYLFRVNGWAVYGALMFLASINWDIFIARYNLETDYQSQVDTEFLLALSDKTLPLLLEHKDVFIQKDIHTQEFRGSYARRLINKMERFEEKIADRSWLSWNQADYQTAQYLHAHGYANQSKRLQQELRQIVRKTRYLP